MQIIVGDKEFTTRNVCIGIKLSPKEVEEFLNNLKNNNPVLKVKSDIYKEKKKKFPELFRKLRALSKYRKRIKKVIDRFIEEQTGALPILVAPHESKLKLPVSKENH